MPPPPTCIDDILNEGETDVDCGGRECTACSVGQKCVLATDCASSMCLSGTCQTPTCSDALKNGNESDVDCGGSCAKCGAGEVCNGPTDCQSGACANNLCAAPSCSDGVKNGVETDIDCGGSCGACALGKSCAVSSDCGPWSCDAGRCGLGTGADGALTVAPNTNQVINTAVTPAAGSMASTTLTLGNAAGFTAGKTVFIHQTQGAGAGKHELNKITSVAGNILTLATPLANDYMAGAQAVVVPQYTTVTIGVGGLLSAPSWNGSSNGILVFQATGSVTVDGTITMTQQGFVGGGVQGGCFPGSPGCVIPNGRFGESEAGSQNFGSVDANGLGANNGSGGGGGTRGQDCAAGGGGSHATVGGAGTNGLLGTCRSSAIHGGGAPGTIIGVPDLTQTIFFGGGGGEGGPDEDGTHAGVGGRGGGIIVIFAGSLTVNDQTGAIDAGGVPGGPGVNGLCLGGSGSGMGNGGAGAGGSIRIFTGGVTALGTGRVTALGGIGNVGGGGCGQPGGSGGVGRIHVRSGGYQTGITNPAAYDL